MELWSEGDEYRMETLFLTVDEANTNIYSGKPWASKRAPKEEIDDQSRPIAPTPRPRRPEPSCWARTELGKTQQIQEREVSIWNRRMPPGRTGSASSHLFSVLPSHEFGAALQRFQLPSGTYVVVQTLTLPVWRFEWIKILQEFNSGN
uniref:Uncharacterized protein n=2 Tax=Oryza nivara TaxID=4536 RepID=A0A0E0H8K7_ORYNI